MLNGLSLQILMNPPLLQGKDMAQCLLTASALPPPARTHFSAADSEQRPVGDGVITRHRGRVTTPTDTARREGERPMGRRGRLHRGQPVTPVHNRTRAAC